MNRRRTHLQITNCSTDAVFGLHLDVIRRARGQPGQGRESNLGRISAACSRFVPYKEIYRTVLRSYAEGDAIRRCRALHKNWRCRQWPVISDSCTTISKFNIALNCQGCRNPGSGRIGIAIKRIAQDVGLVHNQPIRVHPVTCKGMGEHDI